MSDLDRAYATLRAALAADSDVTIQRLPEDQMFISSHLMPSPEAGGKVPQLVPAPNGYTIHIKAVRNEAAARPEQRMSDGVPPQVWRAGTIPLRHDRESLDGQWEIQASDGARFIMTVRCGSAAVFDDVDRVLAVLETALSE